MTLLEWLAAEATKHVLAGNREAPMALSKAEYVLLLRMGGENVVNNSRSTNFIVRASHVLKAVDAYNELTKQLHREKQ